MQQTRIKINFCRGKSNVVSEIVAYIVWFVF